MHPILDIVVVNWRSGDLVDGCLRAVATSVQSGFELGWVHVVDNSPEEPYVPRSAAGLRLNILTNRDNRGFAAACNQAARIAASDYVLFLNPDCRVVPETIAAAMGYFATEAGRRCGALGVQLLDEEGRLQRTCTEFPSAGRLCLQALGGNAVAPRLAGSFMVDFDHRSTRAVDQVMGAFLLMPRALFLEMGGFDERFFLYFEDLDLCLRLRQAGHEVIYFADAHAVHAGQGTTRKALAQRQFLHARSRLLYCAKHFGTDAALRLGLVSFLVEPVLRLVNALFRGGPGQTLAVIRGARLLWRDLPRLLQVVRLDSRSRS